MAAHDTPYTALIKHIVKNNGRTRRTRSLMITFGVFLLLFVGAVAAVAIFVSPTVAAVGGGVPVGAAGIAALVSRARQSSGSSSSSRAK